MADNTPSISAEDQAKAVQKYNQQQMLKKVVIGIFVVVVIWFAYKSFIK